jgi:hypothetical protein
MTTLMKKSLEGYTIAKSESDILTFIADIESGKMVQGQGMAQWVRDNIAISYPKVSQAIIEDIYKSIYEQRG